MRCSSHPSLVFVVSSLTINAALPVVSHCASPDAAAKSSVVENQFQSARAYLTGKGAPVDPLKAFELMSAAAEGGHPDAIGGMGYFYASGIAVEKDERVAVNWFRKGAEKGSLKAQYNLGRMLSDGKGVAPDLAAGLQWIQKAADHGLMEAQVEFGGLLFFGRHGLKRDEARAFPYLLKAAEQGDADSQNSVGYILQHGIGVRANEAEAERWLQLAARQGHGKAQSNLGRLLNPRSSSRTKRVEALKWLVAAANQNEITAKKTLEDLGVTLDANEMREARAQAASMKRPPAKLPGR